MAGKNLNKATTLIVLLSLVLQSFTPVDTGTAYAAPAQPGDVNSPSVESSAYQPPIFGRPTPRTGNNDNQLKLQPSLTPNSSGYQWHTFYGSLGADFGEDITTDSNGNIYVVGISGGTWKGPGGVPLTPLNPPCCGSGQYITIAKFSSNGARLWHTFLGMGQAKAIALDESGNIYVAGTSGDWSGPGGIAPLHPYSMDPTGASDNFILKLSNNGAYQWHTIYGGTNDDFDGIHDIAVDNSGNVGVVGQIARRTGSTDWVNTTPSLNPFPENASRAIVVGKFSPTGDHLWHTIYGNSVSVGYSYGYGLVIDSNNDIFVSGLSTASWEGPNGQSPLNPYDGSSSNTNVIKLSSDGTYQWHSFYPYTTDYFNNSAGTPKGNSGMTSDRNGNLIIVGTSRSNWYGPNGEMPIHQGGYYDIVVLKISSSGQYLWHTFFGTAASSDNGLDVSTDMDGSIYIAAESSGAWNGPNGELPLDPYAAKWDIVGLSLSDNGSYQWHTFYGSNDTTYDDGSRGVAVSNGSVYITGHIHGTWNGPNGEAPLNPIQGNVEWVLISNKTQPTIVSDLTTYSSILGMDGNLSCIAVCSQETEGGPINTRTGGYDYSATDIAIQSAAGEVSFERTYASLATSLYSTNLGYGWTHNHDLYLTIGAYDANNIRNLTLKGHTANKYVFTQQSGFTTTKAESGIYASLVQGPSSFILTDKSQNKYEFNLTTGKLISYTNPTGQKILYTFDTRGRLIKISDQSGQRYLTLAYSGSGTKIISITDYTGRKVSYGYDANNNLISITDILGKIWKYTYDANHNILQVLDPNNAVIERTEYDANGRAVRQYDGANNLVVELIYNADGTTTVKDALVRTETHTYDSRKTLTGQSDAVGGTNKTYDYNFRPSTITDAAGNTTSLSWSGDGANLTTIKDALQHQTNITYDSRNNPTGILDPSNYLTRYFYEDPNFPALLTKIEYPLSFDGGATFINTRYEYYQTGNPQGQPAGKLKLETDALGNQTFYTYISSGQVAAITTAYGTLSSQTTSYTYDLLGNLINQTDSQGVVTHNDYDSARHLTRVTRNYDTTHLQNDQNIYNLRTDYRYDVRGNQIAVTDTKGTITRTYYNSAGRPATVVENLVGQTIDIATPPARGASPADQNLRTDMVYAADGALIATIDPAGVITRTYYDNVARPVTVVNNLVGQDILTASPPARGSVDQNIRTDTTYDTNGNVIAITDPNGIITRTYYDVLNRPITTVQNLTGQTISISTPPERGSGDQNVRTDTYYDANGNMIATVDPLNITARTYYDAMYRPITVVQNLTGQPISNTTPPDRNATASGQNLRTDTFYDQVGSVIATQDPKGIVTRTYYDSANRPVTIVKNLAGQDIYVTVPPAGGGTIQNIRTDIAYDQYGQRSTTSDPLLHVTKYEYNRLDQMIKVTGNYLVGQPQNYQDQYNLVTSYAYDALGHAESSTDTLGRVSLNSYDKVGRLLSNIQNYLSGQPANYQNQFNIMTVYTYDIAGNRRTMQDPNGHTTSMNYDALNRPISVTDANNNTVYTTYDAVGNVLLSKDGLDHATTFGYDGSYRQTSVTDSLTHATQYGYDAAGNRISITDANGLVTRFENDAVGRINAVVENYRAGVLVDNETNVRTEYTYDLNGNRLTVKDGNGHIATSTYDELNRLYQEADALNNTWTHFYDAVGNQTSVMDANGATTQYTYDAADRLTGINYPAGTPDVTFAYDAGGRRTSMTDGAGTTTWTFDKLDRPTTIQDPFNATVGYGYDPAGNLTSLAYPGGQTVNYTFDNANRLTTVNGLSSIVNYTYDNANRLTNISRPNGVASIYTYDNADRLLSFVHAAGAQNLASYQYTYDPAGNRTQVIEEIAIPEGAFPTAPLTAPLTETPTITPTVTETATETLAPTATTTALPPATPTETFAPTASATNPPPATPTETFMPTFTPTEFPTLTMTPTQLGFNRAIYLASFKLAPPKTKTPTPLVATNTPSITPTFTPTPTATNTPTPTNTPIPLPPPVMQTVTIDYTYDPLYRLTAADYSDSRFYHYTYDAVGNRLTQQSHLGNDTYTYDDLNRLTSVNDVAYTWDNNGNLLNDGVNTYAYDSANRLTSVLDPSSAVSYTYNGLGDRLSQDGVNYTLDLNAGLTQVLSDETTSYTYGLDVSLNSKAEALLSTSSAMRLEA